VGRLSRAAAAAGRGAARLVPAGRRDWAEAIWAEAYEVPSGLRRLAWLAGGVQVIAREALTARRPRARYVVGVGPRLQMVAMTHMPTRMRDRVLRVISGSP